MVHVPFKMSEGLVKDKYRGRNVSRGRITKCWINCFQGTPAHSSCPSALSCYCRHLVSKSDFDSIEKEEGEEEEEEEEEQGGGEMENGTRKWGSGGAENEPDTTSTVTIKGIISLLMANVDEGNDKSLISLGMGDPSAYSCFRTTSVALETIIETVESNRFNGYAPTQGLPQTRKAIAEYLSRDLPYELSLDDVFVTSGCTQAIDVALSILARPGANILIPKPGFPIYQLISTFRGLEARYYDLLPEKKWEVNLDAIEALADQNTVALVIINPNNPCGSVYSYQHLKKIAETASKLSIPVIADEVYGHLAFGGNPFVPMGSFGTIVPVFTLGSLSKRWIVPGWRLGWFVISDPTSLFMTLKIIERLKKYFDILGGPATFIQAAVPRIIEQTDGTFFKKTINILKQDSDVCWEKMQEIPCIDCPNKPEGSMVVMAKLNLSLLEDISDDIDFCFKLAKEESVIVLPGVAVGLKNWLRITFAADPSFLEEGLERIKSFCRRHSNTEHSN